MREPSTGTISSLLETLEGITVALVTPPHRELSAEQRPFVDGALETFADVFDEF